MIGPFTKFRRTLEDAVEAYLTAVYGADITGVTIFKASSRSELSVPRIHISCISATPDFTATGLLVGWTGQLVIGVVTHYKDTTRDQHTTWSAIVEDFAMTENIADQFNSIPEAAGIQLYDGIEGWTPGESSDVFEGSEQRSAIMIQVRGILEEA